MSNTQTWLTRILLALILLLMGLVVWVKVTLGWEARSLSLLTQAFHTFIICFNTLFGLFTVSSPDQPDGRVIYGHSQRETLFTFILVASLTMGSLFFFWMGIPQARAVMARETLPFPLQVSPSLLQFLALVGAIPLGLAGLSGYQARLLNHPILGFTTKQLVVEAVLTMVVLLGLWGVWWGESLFDLLLAIIIYLLCLDRFWQVISWQFPLMLEQTAIAPEALMQIALQLPGVKRCDRIRSRGIVGQFVYIQMHLLVDRRYEPMTQNIVRSIEAELRRRYGSLQVTFYLRHN